MQFPLPFHFQKESQFFRRSRLAQIVCHQISVSKRLPYSTPPPRLLKDPGPVGGRGVVRGDKEYLRTLGQVSYY